MTDTTMPIEDLRTAWEAATELASRIGKETPQGDLMFAEDHRLYEADSPRRLFSPKQSDRLAAARAEQMRLTLALYEARTRLRSEAAGL